MSAKCENLDLVSSVTRKTNGKMMNEGGNGLSMDSTLNSRDEVDFVKPDVCIPCGQNNRNSSINNNNNNNINTNNNNTKNNNKNSSKQIDTKVKKSTYCDIEVKSCVKSSLERLPMFQFPRKKSDPLAGQSIRLTSTMTGTATTAAAASAAGPKERPKFVKSASIARLLGNTYNTKRSAETFAAENGKTATGSVTTNTATTAHERFQKCSTENENDISVQNAVKVSDFCEDRDVSARAFRTISKGLSRLLWRKSHSVEISAPDPEYKVSYLGNVLTGWAKGENCLEKPLAALWRNYAQHNKPDVVMKVKVCPSGLKATTRQHGLTEYWSHRITNCSAPKNYPRVFCWIYRHEGRKLKHEFRCHAILCAKDSIADEVSRTLKENLARALKEFKKDKINRQNARLSLANSVYDNPSMPRRKILLSVGSNNYRPPLERSKSAPRLMAIEEAIGEEDYEEDEDHQNHHNNNHHLHHHHHQSHHHQHHRKDELASDRISCCVVDPIYPAMTLGRRRCRKGHSIRRTGSKQQTKGCATVADCKSPAGPRNQPSSTVESEDDLDKLLLGNDYDTNSPLAGELMSYFDMKLSTNQIEENDDEDDDADDDADDDDEVVSVDYLSISKRPSLSMDDLDNFSDRDDEDNSIFYNQDDILDILAKESKARSCQQFDESSDVNSISSEKRCNGIVPNCNGNSLPASLPDSDEGSISSGCETASTVTTSLEESTNNKVQQQQNLSSTDSNDENGSTISVETTIIINGKRTKPLRQSGNSENGGSAVSSESGCGSSGNNDDSESELSDESGYVEYQNTNNIGRTKT